MAFGVLKAKFMQKIYGYNNACEYRMPSFMMTPRNQRVKNQWQWWLASQQNKRKAFKKDMLSFRLLLQC